ncbi:hypothetical protein BVG19_g4061 [[Candida] boidinii]|nr:hypothetical protein BVG19_g4061 [[Candida] boidinii]OWB52948.1 hypothetical protein B5S27_g4533 [[Candida] boidinii]
MSNNSKYTDSIKEPTQKDKTRVGFSFTSTPSLTDSLRRLSISNYFGSSTKKKEINGNENLISKNEQENNSIEDIIIVRSSNSSPLGQYNNSNNIHNSLKTNSQQSPSPLPPHLLAKSNSKLPPTPDSERQNTNTSATPSRLRLRETPTRQNSQMRSPVMKTEIENSHYETSSHDLDEDTKQTLSMLLSLGDDEEEEDDDDDDDEGEGQGQQEIQVLADDVKQIDDEVNTVKEKNLKSFNDKSNRNLLKELENEEEDIDIININKEDQSSIRNVSGDEDENHSDDDDDEDDMVDAKSRHSDYDPRASIKSKQSYDQVRDRSNSYRNGKMVNKKVSQYLQKFGSRYDDKTEDNINDDDSDIVYHVDDLNIDDEVEAANKINEIKSLLSNRNAKYNSVLDDITRFEEDNHQILNKLLQIDRDLDTFKISFNEVLQDTPSSEISIDSRSNHQEFLSQQYQQQTSIIDTGANHYDLVDISDTSEIEVDLRYLIGNKLKKLNNSAPSNSTELNDIDQTVMSNLGKFIESTFQLLNNTDNLDGTSDNKNEDSKLMKLNNELKIKSNILIQSVSDLTYSLT